MMSMCGVLYPERFEEFDCVQYFLDICKSHAEYCGASFEPNDKNILWIFIVYDKLRILEFERKLVRAQASLDRSIVNVEYDIIDALGISVILVVSESNEWV